MRLDVSRLFRPLLGLLVFLVFLGASSVAVAAPRDKAALKKIEEAMFEKFLNTDFDSAEGLLLGTLRACEDKCSPEVKGKAWMYVGVVRGSGRNDMKGAEEAFKNALKEDENVKLDEQVASDEVKALFAKVSGGGGEPPPPAGKTEAPAGGMKCSLEAAEVQSRRPIPIACESDKDLEKAKLFFESFGSKWSSVPMEVVEGVWNGTIPCSATQNTGGLRWYVVGLDADDEEVDSSGAEDDPNELDIVAETETEPPAFPGEEPPERCGVIDQPPGGGGACGGWGESCGDGGCCDTGLACQDGTCQAAGCESDSDCTDGKACVDGRCKDGEAGGGEAAQNWIGAHFAIDETLFSASGACTADSRLNNHFNCFNADGTTYQGTPNVNAAGNLENGGFVLSTMSVLLSYERLFGPIGAEARVGFAFNGGRPPEGGDKFLPVRAEVRLKYWFRGQDGFKKKGLRPWVHVGGGLAEVDATVNMSVVECAPGGPGAPVIPGCETAPISPTSTQPGPTAELEVTKVLGLTFITAGGGLMYGIGPNHGPTLNLNLMLMVPSTGFVIQPSLGYSIGF